jgi:hypothetical protein
MPVRRENFTVLMFLDRDLYGYDEHMLPPLIALMDSASRDHRAWTHTGPTGYFLTSPSSRDRIRRVIEQAELLRTSDSRFERLGICHAEGPMVAEFTWLGRLKTEMTPLGSRLIVAPRQTAIATHSNRSHDKSPNQAP